MALESKEFCNTYLRSVPRDEGLVTLSGFLHFWGIVFLVTTTLVAFFKKESPETENHQVDHPKYNIQESYNLLLKILKMKPILLLMAVMLTVKISFAACDSVTTLKLIDLGIPKDKLALLAVPLVPLQIILPLIISKYTVGKYPMSVYLKAIPYRLVLTMAIACFVWVTPFILSGRDKGSIPYYYYVALLLIYGLYQVRD
jgi:PAT family acetyl-CoA transporter-like MFS transporter 1